MAEGIRVCHVVNTVQDTTMAGDLTSTQAAMEAFDQVGILAWFDVGSFQSMDRVETVSLNVPNTFRITRAQYATAKSVLSEYDVVHTHHPHSGFYGKLIAKRLGKPVVHTEHNNHDGFTRKGRTANGATNVLADAVACVSESVRESFFRWEDIIVRDTKLSVIHNGVDIERLEAARDLGWSIHDVANIDSEAVVVGSAGMLTEQKAHEVLIEAVDRANAESEQPIELVVSGDGELREELETQIEAAKYSERLHLLGFLEEREQVYKMMHEIDIYAMPSRWEGFCVAALEAMALRNACVFSDIPEFRRPFDEIAYFHEIDNASHLSRQIKTLAGNQKEKQQLGKKASECIYNKYTIEITAEKYRQMYENVR